ncbi:hypothetical protein [Leeuwenhoekiella parthenopeia]|uniref:Uncharacterized protein n=1 Tax=Leeuwenhoekiella parthenopeia TaxID=2890320 RepID=A0ABS8GPF0_9FLAO|nr:hypothetical protein [Leeuwenhoekiella parthenopeia]MCC4211393.1 hypothetical protein [Leeuwenhoekiella parthenopeia]
MPNNNSANPIVVLGKEMTANTKYFILFEELVELVKVLTDYLGDDEHGRSEFKSEESLLLNSTLRRWLLNELIIELVVYNEHIQLYFKYIT